MYELSLYSVFIDNLLEKEKRYVVFKRGRARGYEIPT